MVTSKGEITTREYDDGIAKGIQIILNGDIVAMLDVYADGSEARVLVYSDKDIDEPTDCIDLNV